MATVKERKREKAERPEPTETDKLDFELRIWAEAVKWTPNDIDSADWAFKQTHKELDHDEASIIPEILAKLRKRITEIIATDISPLDSSKLEALREELNSYRSAAEQFKEVLWNTYNTNKKRAGLIEDWADTESFTLPVTNETEITDENVAELVLVIARGVNRNGGNQTDKRE
ncbi:MAG: hypothetical protein ABI758_01090 [Candidatus Woesebacteria bacterium]